MEINSTKSERIRNRETRHQRLAETEGMPIHVVIDLKLLRMDDWVEVAGANYPQKNNWVKMKTGRIRYVGKLPDWERREKKEPETVQQVAERYFNEKD